MRLRHIPGSEEEIANSPYVIQNPENKKGLWKEVFGNENPIEIEVGMGKGRFIMELAVRKSQVNSLLSNIYFMCIDAKNLPEIFAQGEVEKIYLNFSDPWPKDRHAKRRLTSEEFMAVYNQILASDGAVEFKTDNKGLFDYSLESIPAAGWEIKEHTYDLHHSDMGIGNVMTEYEEKFSSKGNPIFKLIAKR